VDGILAGQADQHVRPSSAEHRRPMDTSLPGKPQRLLAINEK